MNKKFLKLCLASILSLSLNTNLQAHELERPSLPTSETTEQKEVAQVVSNQPSLSAPTDLQAHELERPSLPTSETTGQKEVAQVVSNQPSLSAPETITTEESSSKAQARAQKPPLHLRISNSRTPIKWGYTGSGKPRPKNKHVCFVASLRSWDKFSHWDLSKRPDPQVLQYQPLPISVAPSVDGIPSEQLFDFSVPTEFTFNNEELELFRDTF